jgi:hypothetical protein
MCLKGSPDPRPAIGETWTGKSHLARDCYNGSLPSRNVRYLKAGNAFGYYASTTLTPGTWHRFGFESTYLYIDRR